MDTCFTVQVVDVLGDEGFQEAARLPGGQHLVSLVGPRLVGIAVEVVQLQHPGVILAPQAAGPAEGRDAAFNLDAHAREGGEVAGGADKSSGVADGVCNV